MPKSLKQSYPDLIYLPVSYTDIIW